MSRPGKMRSECSDGEPRTESARDPRHRLLLLGYWSNPDQEPQWSCGRPDPRDVSGEWSGVDRDAVVARLRNGNVLRIFLGVSACRLCGQTLGSRELTDGVWAWPEGLDHYVEAHATRLPEAFVAAARHSDAVRPGWVTALAPDVWTSCGDSIIPLDTTVERTWILDEGVWLDWAATNTAARPADDAATLDDAREVARRLSHPGWHCAIDDVSGRWGVAITDDAGTSRLYLQKCSTSVLERRLLDLRIPDATRALSPERAQAVAAEYDGAWGAARLLAYAERGAWLVWVKRPESDWPTEQRIDEILEREPPVGWTSFYPDGGKSFVMPAADEIAWRSLLTSERERPQLPVWRGRSRVARWWAALRKRFFRR